MVEDYLTDRDQEEALRNWWRENWNWILGGIALGLGAAGRLTVLAEVPRPRRPMHGREAVRGFQKALDGNDVDAGRQARSTDLAGEHAKLAVHAAGPPAAGQAACRRRQASTRRSSCCGRSPTTRRTRSWRTSRSCALARLLIQQGKHDEALKLLDVAKAGAFAAQVREIRGDALLAKGDAQGARAEYAAALAGDTKGADRSRDRRAETAGRRRRRAGRAEAVGRAGSEGADS